MDRLIQQDSGFTQVKDTGLEIPCPVFYWLCISVMCLSLLCSLPLAHAQSDNGHESAKSTIVSRDVIVSEGDTLRTLALEHLGRAGFAPMLAEFNDLVESAPLISGNIIRIPIHVPARGEFAEVVFVKGNATLMRRADDSAEIPVAANTASGNTGAGIILERNAQIQSGDTITTGPNGYVSIAFSTGSVVNLQPGTTATLQRLNCLPNDDSCLIEIIAEDGKVLSDIEHRDNQPVEFRISTPYASAAVRGTIFDMAAADDLKVGVTEGAVSLSAQNKDVNLDTGFGAIVEPGQTPSDPIALLPPPVFKRVPTRVAPGDTVTWWPFSDASSYGAKISNDEAAVETLEAFDVAEDSISFDNIASGDYYLTVRAVDSNGLQGFTSNTRLTIAQIDPDVEPVSTVVSRQGSEFLVTVENGPEIARGYEIQVANDDTFADPLSVDVNEKGSAIFRLDNTRVFTRARVLLDPYTVSAFGETSSSDSR